mmetsp:Transcript_66804/g.196084  ORF Transcript_66804/g.196084 Transcript_66804/m.196084 type:complete len:211 (+) Transcript_66804:94-726(+)
MPFIGTSAKEGDVTYSYVGGGADTANLAPRGAGRCFGIAGFGVVVLLVLLGLAALWSPAPTFTTTTPAPSGEASNSSSAFKLGQCHTTDREVMDQWSSALRAHCCLTAGRGCPGSEEYDCAFENHGWQPPWSSSKRAWCCKHESKGCETPATTTRPVGYFEALDECNSVFRRRLRSRDARSADKQAWCCRLTGVGCPESKDRSSPSPADE